MRCRLLALLLCAAPTLALATVPFCAGDCDGDGTVRIDELIRGVDTALARVPVGQCAAVDGNDDGHVGVDELVAAVSAALGGCAPPTPMPTATPTSESTATPSPTATSTSESTPTPSPTATASDTAMPTPSPTASETLATASATPALTPSASPTATDVLTPSRTGTATRSATPSRTWTPTSTSTRTRTVTATRTNSATPLATRTATEVVASTVTRTAVPTRTATRTATTVPTPEQFLRAQLATERGCIENGQSPAYLIGETIVVIYRIDGVLEGAPLSTALATLIARAPDESESEIALGVVPAGVNRTVVLSAVEPTGVVLLRLRAAAPGVEEPAEDVCSVVVAQPVE